MTPPSERFIGGSSEIERAIKSWISGSSKIFSDKTCSRRLCASDNDWLMFGVCERERFKAKRSRGVAVPRFKRPTRRSKSETSFKRKRILSRRMESVNSETAESRVWISERFIEGRRSHERKRRAPIPVTVASMTLKRQRL